MTRVWPVIALFLSTLGACSSDEPAALRHPDTRYLEPAVRSALSDARARFDQADLTGPGAAQAYADLGMHYLAHHLNDGAADAFDRARERAPDATDWHYYFAQASAARGDTNAAIDALKTVLELDPGDTRAAYWLGRWHLDQANTQAATPYVERALAGAAQDAAVLALAGELALIDERYADARGYFRDALKRQPAATRLYYPLARAQRDDNVQTQTQWLARAGDGEVRLDDPRMNALARFSRSTQMLLEQGGALLGARRFADAAAVFEQATQRNPDDVYAWTSLGRTREVLGNVDGARAALGRALELDPTAATARLFLGMLNERQGDDAAAITAYRAALSSDAASARPRLLLAHALLRQGRPDEAQAAYEQVVAQRAGNLLARYYLILIHLSEGRCADAGPLLDDAQQLKANYGPVLEIRARYTAVCGGDERQLREAADIASQLAAARPDARSAVTRAMVMRAIGDRDAAREAVQQARTLAAGTPLAAEILAHLSDDGAAQTAWPPGSLDLMPPRLGPDSLR